MDLDAALTRLADDPAAPLDLAELALAIARDEYPHLDTEGELAELNAMAHEVRPRLRGKLLTRVEALCRYLFHEQGFRGNERDYYDPRNSYLNDVLDRHLGLPITLSVIAIAVGQRAGLEVAGVGLPGHFIARAEEGGEVVFFDPFHGGRILSVADCEKLVERVVGVPFRASPDALTGVPAGAIVLRMLVNLKGVYQRLRDHARTARVVGRLCQLVPEDAMQVRDLGIALLQTGRAGQAIGPLERYLQSEPPPDDALQVRELLAEAQVEVARWN